MKLTDAELIAAIETEEAQSTDARAGELAQERTDALARYKGDPIGNEVPGRSQVVDKTVLDTIEWIMPSLIRIYLGGDDVGQFEPISPEDEEAAKAETEACNWYINTKNDSFSQFNSTLRDALLLKNGYIVGYWKVDDSIKVETYKGMSDEEVAMLMQDDEVEVVEHTEYPDPAVPPMPPMGMMQPGLPPMPAPMLHDVKVERKRADEFVAIESVPPDELLVSRRHRWTSLMDADFLQWRRRVSIGQLRAEGFEVDDDVPGYRDLTQESNVRDRFMLTDSPDDETPDPARRMVMFKDTYMRIDLRGTGVPQLWRIAFVDGSAKISLREEADVVPFAAFSPIIYPHSHVGSSVYDLINDIGVIKTTLMRQYLDGVYLQNNGQKAVDINRVNLDDLLISRPGGIVRVDGDPSAVVMPLVSPDVGQSALSGLEYMDSVKEGRTGVTRYSAGLDANTLNKTATGVQAIQSAANQRIELIARTLASGFRDLFLIVHALALKHSTKPLQMKIRGKWTPVNPREWTTRKDFNVTVGLGTGTPDAQLQKLMMVGQMIGPMAQGAGLVGPMETFNFCAEVLKAAGYKMPDKFIKQPQVNPQTGQVDVPPPPPPPEILVAQENHKAIVDQEHVKQQGQAQTKQMDLAYQAQRDEQNRQAEFRKTLVEQGVKAMIESGKLQGQHHEAVLNHVHAIGETASNERMGTHGNVLKALPGLMPQPQQDMAEPSPRQQRKQAQGNDKKFEAMVAALGNAFGDMKTHMQALTQAHMTPKEVTVSIQRDAKGKPVGAVAKSAPKSLQ